MSVASSAAGAGLPSVKGSPSVLVVEDDPSLATQLVRGLSRGGYRVDHVMTGQEALAQYQRSDICAVPAASIVGEAMVAFVLADAFLEKFGGDSVADIAVNYQRTVP